MDDRKKTNFNLAENNSLESKKAVIEKIQKTIGEYKTQEQSTLVQNLLKMVSNDIYSEERRFIAEIIQNSDDASVSSQELRIHIYLFDNHILIGHYGKEFDENDVRSICYAGDSTKKQNKDTTGYKGIGFKSVFKQAKKVFVISGGYQFRFEENKDKARQLYPWQIFPIWSTEEDIEDVEIFEKAKDFKVGIILELKNKKIFEECKDFFLEFKYDQNYLLFLKCPNVEFKIFEKNKETLRIRKSAYKDNKDKFIINCLDKTSENSHNQSSEGHANDKNTNKDNKKNKGGSNQEQLLNCYYMKKYYCDMEKDENITKEDMDTITNDEQIPSKLKDLKNIEISFAVKLTKDANSIVPFDKCERIIYSYLPTKVNYNFPFLLNSNFILDAGRGLLKDHVFNKCQMSVLPKYISKFQEDVRISFFNQYALVLVKEFNIDNKKFEKIFSQNLEYEKCCYSQILSLYTLKSIKKNFRECFCEDMALDNIVRAKPLNNQYMNNLLNRKKPLFNSLNEKKIMDFLRSVIEDQSVSDSLEEYLKEFFKRKRGITYQDENRIDSKDVENVRNIANYYNVEKDIVFLNFDDLVEFLKSEYYREIYSAPFLLRLLDKLKKTSFLDKFKNADLKILKNNRGEFISPVNAFYYENPIKDDEMEISNLNVNTNNNINSNYNLKASSIENNLDNENTNRKTKRNTGKSAKKEIEKAENAQNDLEKYLISYEIYEIFVNENKLALLNDIGVQSHSSNEQVENIIKNIHIYDENNSYKITKILFEQWRKSPVSERKKYVDILRNKKLHTQRKGFIHPHCVILGRTFCEKENFDQFSDWFLNEKYWNYFFDEDLKKIEKIGITQEENKHIDIKLEKLEEVGANENERMIIDDELNQGVFETEELNADDNHQTNNLNQIVQNKRSAGKNANSKTKSKSNKNPQKVENPNPKDKKEKEIKKQLYKNFSDFREFFKQLEIWIEPLSFISLFTKENFFDFPFFDRKFIEINRKKFESDYNWYIFNSPYFLNLYEKDFNEVAKFFKENITNIDEEELDKYRLTKYLTANQIDIKARKLFDDGEENFEDFEKKNAIQYKYCNYFKWFLDENGKKIPTTLNTVEKVENVLSYDVLKRLENEDIRKIYFENLSFCYNQNIWEQLSKVGYKFKEKLDFDNYQIILRSLHKKYISLTDEGKNSSTGVESEIHCNLDNQLNNCKIENEARKSSRKPSNNKKILSKHTVVKDQIAKIMAKEENISKDKLKLAIKTEYKSILDILYSLNTNKKLEDDIYLLNMDDDFIKPSELIYDEKYNSDKNTSSLFNRNQSHKANLNSKSIYISCSIRQNCRNIELIDKTEIDLNNYKNRCKNFFKANNIQIASESENHIAYSDLNEESFFKGYWNIIKEKLFRNFRFDNEKKLTNITLFSTDELETHDKFGDSLKMKFSITRLIEGRIP